MTITVKETYKQGVLKPITKVEVIVFPQTEKYTQAKPADILAAIAAMPLENTSEFSGQDHDQLLYSQSNQ